MGATAFLVLFLLGILLSTVGGIIGIIDAFQVSPVWGLLSLLVPFALLVYWFKFRQRQWARNSLLLWLGGVVASLLSLPLLGTFLNQRGMQIGGFGQEASPGVQVPIESVPLPGEEAPGDEVFAEPLVPVAPQLAPIARADLIQSTDPNERVQQITSSRSDPFAIVAIPPPVQVVPPPPPVPGGAAGPPAPGGIAPGPVAQGTPGAGAGAPGAGAPGAGAPGAGAPGAGAPGAGAPGAGAPGAGAPGAGAPGATGPGGAPGAGAPGAGTPGVGQAPPPLAALPALPQPALAEAVLVTGVMTIGNENFAVVQTAAGSQYVRAGQRVANGQVLVKRIDLRGREPVVVLEENGIEVSRPVGGPPPGAQQPSV